MFYIYNECTGRRISFSSSVPFAKLIAVRSCGCSLIRPHTKAASGKQNVNRSYASYKTMYLTRVFTQLRELIHCTRAAHVILNKTLRVRNLLSRQMIYRRAQFNDGRTATNIFPPSPSRNGRHDFSRSPSTTRHTLNECISVLSDRIVVLGTTAGVRLVPNESNASRVHVRLCCSTPRHMGGRSGGTGRRLIPARCYIRSPRPEEFMFFDYVPRELGGDVSRDLRRPVIGRDRLLEFDRQTVPKPRDNSNMLTP